MDVYKEIYFEKLADMIMEAGVFKIHKVGWQVGDPLL